jgi:DNA-binding response OmpR family regulator
MTSPSLDRPVTPTGARILVVEDDDAVRGAVVQILRRAGFDPVPAHNPTDGLALLNDTIDAMLVDLRTPHMRGDAFFFAASAAYPKLRRRTLFMTADISLEAEKLIDQTGCKCLWKPFPNAMLVDAIRAFFEPKEEVVGVER